jgi:hypothetical protein
MIIRNYTPFSPLYFESRDVQGRDFGVFVLRGTFDIIPGQALRPCPKQEPIVDADQYFGEVGKSSLRVESDLAPFKPKTDIHVLVTAKAPGGRPLPDWLVRVKVGAVEKTLRVTGPRKWVKEGGTYRLTDPEPVLEVPIRYEHAFGGIWKDNWGNEKVFEENPVGVGFVGDEVPSYPDEIPAPQIEDPEDPIGEIGRIHKPQGLGPIARSWQPRRGLAGTFDDAWLKGRWPELPYDFDFRFYGNAHPGLTCSGFLRGNEEITMEGMGDDSDGRAYLPSYTLALLLRRKEGSLAVAPVLMDTLTVDLEARRVYLTWRGTFSVQKRLRVLEARMRLPS